MKILFTLIFNMTLFIAFNQSVKFSYFGVKPLIPLNIIIEDSANINENKNFKYYQIKDSLFDSFCYSILRVSSDVVAPKDVDFNVLIIEINNPIISNCLIRIIVPKNHLKIAQFLEQMKNIFNENNLNDIFEDWFYYERTLISP